MPGGLRIIARFVVGGAMKEVKSGSKQGGLLRSTGIVSFFTLLSRVLGMVRDVVVAHYFGAGGGADAFFVAFKIPNFFRRLFSEGAFSQAFVPVLSEYRARRSLDEVRLLVAHTAGSLGGVLLLLTLVCVAFAPQVTYLFAPGFREATDKFQLSSDMLQLTFPYLMLISLTGFVGSILNSYGRFGVPAFTPVLLNVVLILCSIFMAPYMDPPVMALAWGVMLAGVVQFVFQLPYLKPLGLLVRPRWGWQDEGVRRILKLMVPALFGVSVAQINLLVGSVLASYLADGSVSWLYYADRLMEMPLGVFGIAIATVILPSLSRKHASQSTEAFSAMLDWAVRMIMLIGVPSSLALGILATPLLVTLFQYGKFSAEDVAQSALALQAYSLGVLTFMLIKVLAPGFYARQDTKTPVKIGIWSMVANMALSLALIYPLAHTGLALATSVAAFMNAGMLYYELRKEGAYRPGKGWLMFSVRLTTASLAMSGVLLWLGRDLSVWLAWDWHQRVLWLSLMVVAGVVAFFAVLFAAGLRVRHLRSRAAPDPEEDSPV